VRPSRRAAVDSPRTGVRFELPRLDVIGPPRHAVNHVLVEFIQSVCGAERVSCQRWQKPTAQPQEIHRCNSTTQTRTPRFSTSLLRIGVYTTAALSLNKTNVHWRETHSLAPPCRFCVTNNFDCIGIIAGNRSLPLEFARQARAQGVSRLVAVGFENETDPGLQQLVDELVWVKVGQLSKMIKAFTDRGVKHCIMAGQIAPRNLYEVRPDLRAMGVLFRLKERNAHTIFGAIADELHKDGVELIEATPWLKPLMPEKGFRIGPALSKEQQEDIEFGFRIGKEISRLEIGQLVVVKSGTVLAVEGFEGTDKCLARGGELAGKDGGAVAVKVAREKHDLRFDIPCLGPRTIETCAAAGFAALAFEAGTSLLLEQDTCERLANKNKISVVTIG
jgi:UDP-2,3-diacylglucosamine hydrolase